ncbi:ABC transporter ATP-binding protein [Flavobacteriaceae bacterium]|nr:ABC transporter ATP-binding protein [Flavobacteriaceae bacterium]
MSLILENICKSFDQGGKQLKILKDINLEIKQGEIVALVGSSGAGKTTVLQISGLLDFPTSGVVKVNNKIVSFYDEKIITKIRKDSIGFIYQSHHLISELDAIENISLPLLIAGESKKMAAIKAKEILEEIGLIDRAFHFPAQLSGGERQRVSIARAIIKQPSLILADEPTGNLDVKNSDNIYAILERFVRQKNISCLFVTHNNQLAKKTDRIIEISDGQILC